jgi:hypothetical protein
MFDDPPPLTVVLILGFLSFSSLPVGLFLHLLAPGSGRTGTVNPKP